MSVQTTLFWVPDSPFARIAKWRLLAEGIPHSDHVLTWSTLHSDPAFVKISPKGQVPVLVQPDLILADSLRISCSLVKSLSAWIVSQDALLYRTAEYDFAFIMNSFYQLRSDEEHGRDVQYLQANRKKLREHFLGLLDTVLPWAHESLRNTDFGTPNPGLVAFHVFVGFVAYFSPEIQEQLPSGFIEIARELEQSHTFDEMARFCGGTMSKVPLKCRP